MAISRVFGTETEYGLAGASVHQLLNAYRGQRQSHANFGPTNDSILAGETDIGGHVGGDYGSIGEQAAAAGEPEAAPEPAGDAAAAPEPAKTWRSQLASWQESLVPSWPSRGIYGSYGSPSFSYACGRDDMLPNGARFYVDHAHPEYSSPECFDALEAACEPFKVAQTFEIAIDRVAPRARTAPRDGIRHLHDNRFGDLERVFVVMRLHRLNHALANVKLLEDTAPDLDVRALNLVIDRLADVVQKRSGARNRLVNAELLREHAGEMRRLYRMLKQVLPVARAEVETAEERRQLRIKTDDTGLICRGFALLLHNIRNFGTSLLDDLLYLDRLDASVGDEFLERNLRDVPTEWVE